MIEAWVMIALLGVMSACLAVMAVTSYVVAKDVHRTLRSVNRLVSQCGNAVQEGQQALKNVHRMVARADHATRAMERVIRQACDTTEGVLHRVITLKDRAGHILTQWFGNGTRQGARPRTRRS